MTQAVTSPVRTPPPGVLAGPIVPTMLRLALPTIVVLVVQTLVGVAETYFVSFLGTEALAGVALVFPALMLMQMMSNGGIGGGVSSAVARALGANRGDDAQACCPPGLRTRSAFHRGRDCGRAGVVSGDGRHR
jgi:Na+-driven multidrug efflux pump